MTSARPTRRFLQYFSEPVVLLTTFVAIVCAWGFVELSEEIGEADSPSFDDWLLLALRDPVNSERPIGPLWLGEVARDVTALGSLTVLGIAVVLAVGFLCLCRAYRTALFLLAASILGSILCFFAKTALDRPRPEIVPHLTTVQSASFPSGHSMMSAVVYLTLAAIGAAVVEGWRLKIFLLSSAMGLAMIVGVSRVYLGVHYPSDVLAGWWLGLGWAFLCWLVARLLQKENSIVESLDTEHVHGDTAVRMSE